MRKCARCRCAVYHCLSDASSSLAALGAKPISDGNSANHFKALTGRGLGLPVCEFVARGKKTLLLARNGLKKVE